MAKTVKAVPAALAGAADAAVVAEAATSLAVEEKAARNPHAAKAVKRGVATLGTKAETKGAERVARAERVVVKVAAGAVSRAPNLPMPLPHRLMSTSPSWS